MDTSPDEEPLFSVLDRIFTPQSVRRFEEMISRKARLVHYTSAEAAFLIIANKSIWLRNTLFMNDFSEIQYAIDLLAKHFGMHRKEALPFWEAVDRLTAGRASHLRDLYDGWVPDLTNGTYIFSMSEHRDDEYEDEFGRLSMWRAYGKPNSVALVVNPGYLARSATLGAYSYPIEYWTYEDAAPRFDELIEGVLAHETLLSTKNPDEIYNRVFQALHTLALSIKHPGFREEQEWRVVYRPNFERSPVLKERTVTLSGMPQKVFELPLEDHSELGVSGITPAELLDRVIVGPSTHALPMRHAFVEALEHAGVPDAQSRVVCSFVPLRD